jgi:hypothetical protein
METDVSNDIKVENDKVNVEKQKEKKKKKDRIISINKKYEDYKTIYKTVKTSLKSIIRNNHMTEKINDIVSRMNKIKIHTSQFIKLYILKMHKDGKKIPKIDNEFISLVMKTVGYRDSRGGKFKKNKKKLIDDLSDFYDDEYKHLIVENDKISYIGLTQLISYESVSMATDYDNHISRNFQMYLNTVVNVYFRKKRKIEKYKDEQKYKEIKDFTNELRILKNDLWKNTNNAPSKYRTFKITFRKEVIKKVPIDVSLSKMIDDDLMRMRMMKIMINMSIYSEKLGKMRQLAKDKGKPIKIVNVFPLIKSCIPKYITLDSKIIANNLTGKKSTLYNRKTADNFKNIWGEIFKTKSKIFRKKGYKFARSICTDGYACTILFIREDKHNEKKKSMVGTMTKPTCYNEFEYLEYTDDNTKKKLSKMKLLGVDPGKIDLIHVTDGDIKEITRENGKVYRKTKEYKYSQKRRQHELKTKLYAQKKLKLRKDSNINMDDKTTKTVEQLESILSEYNSSSCQLENVKKYVKERNKINSLVMSHYQNELYRKLKWCSYINNQKSESKMINEFKEKYGDPENICLVWGDFSENGKYMKGFSSSKGIGMKRIFKKNGYTVHLVNEAYTSKRLYDDGRELIKCRNKRTPLALKMLTEEEMESKKSISKYNVWKSKSPEIISRDLNGSLNILLKGKCIINKEDIPEYLKHKNINV